VYQDTADDLNKKYHNCYVNYAGVLGFISNFGLNADGSYHCLWKQPGGRDTTKMSPIDPTAIECFNFNSTFINNSTLMSAKDSAVAVVHVSRHPKRQWKRGMCAENTWLRCPVVHLYKAFGKRPNWHHQLSFDLIERLMTPTFPTLARAIEKCNHFIGVAISPMFAVTLSNISSERYLLTSPFGFIGEADAKHIWVWHPPAMQEVQDFVARSNQNISIEVP
jgi:hypothetical protein